MKRPARRASSAAAAAATAADVVGRRGCCRQCFGRCGGGQGLQVGDSGEGARNARLLHLMRLALRHKNTKAVAKRPFLLLDCPCCVSTSFRGAKKHKNQRLVQRNKKVLLRLLGRSLCLWEVVLLF